MEYLLYLHIFPGDFDEERDEDAWTDRSLLDDLSDIHHNPESGCKLMQVDSNLTKTMGK